MAMLRIIRHYHPDPARQLQALRYLLLSNPQKEEAAEDQSAAAEEERRVPVAHPRKG